MEKILQVKALEKYKIWLQYEDGAEGTVDLAKLAGKGVFQKWEEEGIFDQVRIDPESGSVTWNEELQLCPDNLYLQLTKKKPEDLFPSLEEPSSHA